MTGDAGVTAELTDELWSAQAYQSAAEAAARCLRGAGADRAGPYSGASPEELDRLVAAVDMLPEEGLGLPAVLDGLGGLAVRHAVDPTHPATAAHLHCAPAAPAVAANLLTSVTNSSLDSWDQAPVATHLERRAVAVVAGLVGFSGTPDGVFTSGGTQSNLMGLLLACAAAARRDGRDWGADGLGPAATNWRILCSADAHFTVERAAAVLGLGRRAVVRVPVDADRRLDLAALDTTLDRLEGGGQRPIALVATAGTTDFGAIDPLPACSVRARRHELWLHVDAAVGGPLLLSDRHRHRLVGLADADSVGIDFHKLLWQPVACGTFLVREATALAPLDVQVDYLNAPHSDAADGDDGWRLPHQVGRSLATSRRLDALALLMTFQSLGRRRLGDLLDRILDLARSVRDLVDELPSLALADAGANAETVVTVVFRYVPRRDEPIRSDRINAAIRARLLAAGTAVVGCTRVDGRVHLKLTLLNPTATAGDLACLVQLIAAAGDTLDGAP